VKKLFLAGVAVLFLAAGTAYAAEGDFNCDQLPKYYFGGHFSRERTTKDVTLNFSVASPITGKGPCLVTLLSFGPMSGPANCGSTASSASGVSDAKDASSRSCCTADGNTEIFC
jgi:hypothetical protein